MLYELWDTDSGTLLGAYSTEAEALAVIRANVERYGPAYVAAWSLGRLDSSVPVLEGPRLLERAQIETTAH